MLSKFRATVFASRWSPVFFIATASVIIFLMGLLVERVTKAAGPKPPVMPAPRVIWEHQATSGTAHAAVFCVDNVEYLMIDGSLTVKYLSDRRIALCGD